jgi:voltage-gated sodium channel
VSASNPVPAWRLRLQALVQHHSFVNTIIALILINSAILGLQTWPRAVAVAGDLMLLADAAILAVFVLEIGLRIVAYGPTRFVRDPWSLFDFLVVAVALVPASDSMGILRALRVLRVLRLISVAPRMRQVVRALLAAIPGLGSITALLSLVYYVAAVMATTLFGERFPEWFGSLGRSLYTLFQVMTLESWSMGVVRPVMEVYPYAWVFFVPFILITTLTILNLFIAVVVNAMQGEQSRVQERTEAAIIAAASDERAYLQAELGALRRELAELRRAIEDRRRA